MAEKIRQRAEQPQYDPAQGHADKAVARLQARIVRPCERQKAAERNLDCELEVDGGVDAVTCKTCIEAGANVLVAGSAVYKAADIPAKIKELRG